MSNYIYNDNFEGQAPENVNVYYTGKTKKRSLLIILCTSILCLSLVLFFVGGLLNFLASKNNEDAKETVIYVNALSDSNDTKQTTIDNIVANVRNSVIKISAEEGNVPRGNGIIVGEDKSDNSYFVLTTAHVISGANENTYVKTIVSLNDGTAYSAKVCGYDAKSDIAVLKITEAERELPCAVWANSENSDPSDGMAITIGKSGGGVFNTRGELVGLICSKNKDQTVVTPYKDALKAYNQLKSLGYTASQPTIGADLIAGEKGEIIVCSAEQRSMLKEDDIIKAIRLTEDGVFEPASPASIQEAIFNKGIDGKFDLEIYRDGETIYVTVTVYESN